jgi:hypothetical protein
MRNVMIFALICFLVFGCADTEEENQVPAESNAEITADPTADTETQTDPETEIDPETGTEIVTATDPETVPEPVPPVVTVSGPLTKVFLSSISNLGIQTLSTPDGLMFSVTGDATPDTPTDATADTGLLTVDASGDVEEVPAEGGEDLYPAKIIHIAGVPETAIVYWDASGDTEAYLISQDDTAHELSKIPVDQNGLKNSPTIIFSGGFHFLSSDSTLNRAYFDADGVLRIEDVQTGVIGFAFDSRGFLAYSTVDGVYYQAGETELLPGSAGKKLFFANDVSYGAYGNVGGISYWNSDLNAWCDKYWNPEMLRFEWQYSAYPVAAITATVYTGNRQDCEIQRLQARNWLICGTKVYYFGGINDYLSLQDLGYAEITDFPTARRALSDNFLYYADSAKQLKRVDLIQQTAITLSDQYLISTMTVSRDDTLLFSGVTDLEERKFIQIDPDLTETELESAEVEQIQFLD